MSSYTGTAVGNREDLSDIITNIAPDDAPLMGKFGRADVKAMAHSWLTDSIGTPSVNKHLEDASYSVANATPRLRLTNFVQIFMKGYFVTESQEVVAKAGIKSEIAYQMAKAMKEIARDVEYGIINNATSTQGDAVTSGQFGGIPAFNTVNSVDMGGVALSTTGAVGGEAKFNDAMQLAWNAGGSPEIALCSGKNKRAISNWSANTQKTRGQGEKTLINVIDVYQSDFGVIKLMAHRLQPDSRIDMLELQYFKLAYLIPFKTMDLPKDSLKTAKVITGQLTMECRTKNAHAVLTNIV